MSSNMRRGRTAGIRRALTAVGLAVALSIGSLAVAGPAQAASGTWESDVWWVHWWADNSYTKIEPHMFDYAAAAIYRYTPSGPRWYYGPYVYNGTNPYNRRTSEIRQTYGYWIGNYFRHQSINFKLR